MKRDWRRGLRNAISRNDHRSVVAGAVAGLGGAIAIGVMEFFSFAAHYPLAVIPFATSIVLVIGSPDVEPAQPRPDRRSSHSGAGRPRRAEADGAASLGRSRSRRPFHSGDVRDRDLSPAGGHQSTAGSIRQSARDVPAGAGAGRRGAFDRVLLSLAPRGAPPAMAAALALRNRAARMERSEIRRCCTRGARSSRISPRSIRATWLHGYESMWFVLPSSPPAA